MYEAEEGPACTRGLPTGCGAVGTSQWYLRNHKGACVSVESKQRDKVWFQLDGTLRVEQKGEAQVWGKGSWGVGYNFNVG